MSADHSQRHAAQDHRNERALVHRAAVLVRQQQEHEAAVRERTRRQILEQLIQPPEPHHYHRPMVAPISPRRAWGDPAAPGGPDLTGFSDGIC